MNIEGFRSLNQDIETIINKSNQVKKAKKDPKKQTPKGKKKLTEEEKEYKKKRKEIQEKLIKFATRIPVFMYLTDYRERTLKDVITQLEPGLFKKVTGMNVPEFEMLCTLGVFNASLMNDAIFKFKRYEDSSLSYTGIDKHADKEIGGWDTTLTKEEYMQLFYNQQETMVKQRKSPVSHAVSTEIPAAVMHSFQLLKSSEVGPFEEIPKSGDTNKRYHSEDVEMDLSDVSLHTMVYHKTFGEGQVSSLDKAKKHIRVRFAAGEKLFIFPDAFINGFLTLK